MEIGAPSFALRFHSVTVSKLATLRDIFLGHGLKDRYYRCTFQRYQHR